MDPFSIVLAKSFATGLASGAGSWLAGKALDTFADCGRCGARTPSVTTNRTENRYYCATCSGGVKQFTNATQHTVNRNGQIAGALVDGVHWPGWGDRFDIYYDLHVVNSKYMGIVVHLCFSQFRGSRFHCHEYTLNPTYDRTVWRDDSISVPRSRFPQAAGVVAIDIALYNTWGDQLALHRELMDYKGRG